MKTVPIIMSLVILLFLLATGAVADTVQVQNVKVTSIGATLPVNIVMDTSTAGIAGYDITISLSNPDVATITNVSYPSWAILNESTTLPASSVRIRIVDLYEEVESFETNVHLGSVILRGDAAGSTDVIITIKEITSDNGDRVSPLIRTGMFTVDLISDTPTAPTSPVKLIFIHHSSGENWLADGNGGLGIALRDNNYFVSDTNYGWGPDSIGDRTDIPNWYEWFRGPQSATYLSALYAESNQHSSYSRLASDPGGLNKIVMFKSCFPNSALTGDPGDPIPIISENPFDLSISSAKGIYIDLLEYFATKQDTLFVVITAPPLIDGTYSKNARAFNQWLINDWLKDYPYKNVYVFDLYNVLTTNGGSSSVNDLGVTTGNHHRWWDGAVQHQVNLAYNTSAYTNGGDDHPVRAGNQKATGEFIPLLNYAYDQWTTSIISKSDKNGNYIDGVWRLDIDESGTWTASDRATSFGGPGQTPVIGDWNGDGITDIGTYADGWWRLDMNGDGVWSTGDRKFYFGAAGRTPVVGDWDGDGSTEVGNYIDGVWRLDMDGSGTWNTGDRWSLYNGAGQTPVVGDWNGDDVSDIGTYADGWWRLDMNGDGVWSTGDRKFYFGAAGRTPVVGDWDGDGSTEVGNYIDGVWRLDMDGSGTWNTGDRWSLYTGAGQTPVVGDWNGDNVSDIGTYFDGWWRLDMNGDGVWSTGDRKFYFGAAGRTPVVGKWN